MASKQRERENLEYVLEAESSSLQSKITVIIFSMHLCKQATFENVLKKAWTNTGKSL